MQDLKNTSRIYLSGGGNENQSFPLDKFFFDSLPQNGRFLYIPVALRGHTLYQGATEWMKGITNLHKRTDVQFETADDLGKFSFEKLIEFNAIYVGGGNTWGLMQELRDAGFAEKLIQYFGAGGQLYGGSAGAISMGKRIDTQNDENKIGMQDVSGLNLLNDFSVACHFKDDQHDKFKSWTIAARLPILCLSEETGLIIENYVATCVGTKPCYVYLADGTLQEVGPSETFTL